MIDIFKKINEMNFDESRKYISNNFKKIGSGCTRDIFKYDNNTILKVPKKYKNKKSSFNELKIYKKSDIFTKIFDYNNNGILCCEYCYINSSNKDELCLNLEKITQFKYYDFLFLCHINSFNNFKFTDSIIDILKYLIFDFKIQKHSDINKYVNDICYHYNLYNIKKLIRYIIVNKSYNIDNIKDIDYIKYIFENKIYNKCLFIQKIINYSQCNEIYSDYFLLNNIGICCRNNINEILILDYDCI